MNRKTAREIVRHALYRLSLDKLLLRRRVARGQPVHYLSAPSRAKVFEEIYSSGVWLNDSDRRQSRSGEGSELDLTVGVRKGLPEVLATLGARSMVDIGCGDFTWMQHVDLGVTYLGVDVVQSVIDTNTKEYGSAGWNFRCLDAVVEPIPPADVALCREVLFHLSFADATRLLANVQLAGFKYLIATTDEDTGFNSDIRTGDFRILNLEKRPFRFPSPVGWIPDGAVQAGRSMGVWRVGDLDVTS